MKSARVTPTTAINGRSFTTGNPPSKDNLLQRWSGAPVFHLFLIALIGLLAYCNTFHAPFVFDDEGSIVENPVIKDLGSFISGAGYQYNPRRFIGYLTIALNYKLGGLDVTGYHIFNLSVHIISAWFVYALVRLTLKTPFFEGRTEDRGPRSAELEHLEPRTSNLVPLFTALLFIAHPVQTQAVTYTVQRLASLATMFYLASLVCYVKGRLTLTENEKHSELEIQNSKFKILNAPFTLLFLSLISAILAMRTKEIAVTLPVVVLFYEFSFFGAGARKRLILLIPLLLTILIVPLGMLQAGKPLGELLSDVSEMARESQTISRGDYLLTQFSVIVTYIRLLFFPVNQNLDYDYPIYHSLVTPRVFLSFAFLLALLGLAIWLYRRSSPFTVHRSPFTSFQRLIAFGILWFFITLSVESSVIPITDVIFEHRLYLPSIGVFCSVATLFAIIARRFSGTSLVLGVGIVILALVAVTWQRNLVWGSAAGLWQDCIAKSQEKVRPYNNLANALLAQGHIDEAIEQLRLGLNLERNNANTLRNLGAAYEKKGWLDEAIEQYKMALDARFDDAYTHYNLGIAYAKKGFTDLAIEQFLLAIKLNPDYADAYNNLGVAYGSKGFIDEAINQFRLAIRLNPGYVDAHNNLGFAYGKKGIAEKAVEEFKIAISLQPTYAEAYNNMGIVFGMQGAYSQAVEQFQQAISLQPDNPRYRYNLANAYRRKLQKN